jgi:hypothetical protein
VVENLGSKQEAHESKFQCNIKEILKTFLPALKQSIDAGFHAAVFIGWHQNKKHKDYS